MRLTRPLKILAAGAASLAFGASAAGAASGGSGSAPSDGWDRLLELDPSQLVLPPDYEVQPLPPLTPAQEAEAARGPLSQLGPYQLEGDPPGRIG